MKLQSVRFWVVGCHLYAGHQFSCIPSLKIRRTSEWPSQLYLRTSTWADILWNRKWWRKFVRHTKAWFFSVYRDDHDDLAHSLKRKDFCSVFHDIHTASDTQREKESESRKFCAHLCLFRLDSFLSIFTTCCAFLVVIQCNEKWKSFNATHISH